MASRGSHFRDKDKIFVLENIPDTCSDDLAAEYLAKTLDTEVKDVKCHPNVPGRAFVEFKKAIKGKDFSKAARTVSKSPLQSKDVKLLRTKREPAIVVYGIDLEKLSEEALCSYLKSEYADGEEVIESSESWPDLHMAVIHFKPSYQEVSDRILAMGDHVLLSEDKHMSVGPFYQNFHEYIEGQLEHGSDSFSEDGKEEGDENENNDEEEGRVEGSGEGRGYGSDQEEKEEGEESGKEDEIEKNDEDEHGDEEETDGEENEEQIGKGNDTETGEGNNIEEDSGKEKDRVGEKDKKDEEVAEYGDNEENENEEEIRKKEKDDKSEEEEQDWETDDKGDYQSDEEGEGGQENVEQKQQAVKKTSDDATAKKQGKQQSINDRVKKRSKAQLQKKNDIGKHRVSASSQLQKDQDGRTSKCDKIKQGSKTAGTEARKNDNTKRKHSNSLSTNTSSEKEDGAFESCHECFESDEQNEKVSERNTEQMEKASAQKRSERGIGSQRKPFKNANSMSMKIKLPRKEQDDYEDGDDDRDGNEKKSDDADTYDEDQLARQKQQKTVIGEKGKVDKLTSVRAVNKEETNDYKGKQKVGDRRNLKKDDKTLYRNNSRAEGEDLEPKKQVNKTKVTEKIKPENKQARGGARSEEHPRDIVKGKKLSAFSYGAEEGTIQNRSVSAKCKKRIGTDLIQKKMHKVNGGEKVQTDYPKANQQKKGKYVLEERASGAGNTYDHRRARQDKEQKEDGEIDNGEENKGDREDVEEESDEEKEEEEEEEGEEEEEDSEDIQEETSEEEEDNDDINEETGEEEEIQSEEEEEEEDEEDDEDSEDIKEELGEEDEIQSEEEEEEEKEEDDEKEMGPHKEKKKIRDHKDRPERKAKCHVRSITAKQQNKMVKSKYTGSSKFTSKQDIDDENEDGELDKDHRDLNLKGRKKSSMRVNESAGGNMRELTNKEQRKKMPLNDNKRQNKSKSSENTARQSQENQSGKGRTWSTWQPLREDKRDEKQRKQSWSKHPKDLDSDACDSDTEQCRISPNAGHQHHQLSASQTVKQPKKTSSMEDGQNCPVQSAPFEKAEDESEERQNLEKQIRKLTDELTRMKNKEAPCQEKVLVKASHIKLLPHCLGTFDGCHVYFSKSESVVVLEGPQEKVRHCQLKLLKELKTIKEESLTMTPTTLSLLRESGKFLKNFIKNNEVQAFIEDENLVVVAKDEQVLRSGVKQLKSQLNYSETFTSAFEISEKKLGVLQSDLEHKHHVRMSWKKSGTEIHLEGLKSDVISSRDDVQHFIQKFGLVEKSFRVSGPHAKYLRKFWEEKIDSMLHSVKISIHEITDNHIQLTFSGTEAHANKALRSLEKLKNKIVSESRKLTSDFEKEDVMLIMNGFHSEELKNMIEIFENNEKILVVANIPTLSFFRGKFSVSQKSKSHETSRAVYHDISQDQAAQLTYPVGGSCQLLVKLNGDIVAEASDILVCVLDQTSMNLRKTRVGNAFSHACPSLRKYLEEKQPNPNDTVLTAKGPFDSLNCQAVCFVLLSCWDPSSSPAHLADAVTKVLGQAEALGARSISFPVLGCGKAFAFPPSAVAETVLSSIVSSHIGPRLRKITLLANYNGRQLFNEFRKASFNHFSSSAAPASDLSGSSVPFKESDSNDNSIETYIDLSGPEMEEAKVQIIARDDKPFADLWQKLKDKMIEVCLQTDKIARDMFDSLLDKPKCRVFSKAQELFVLIYTLQHPETKEKVYMLKGQKVNINTVKESVLNELQKQNQPQIISEDTPPRGSIKFLEHAASTNEKYPSYWRLGKSEVESMYKKFGRAIGWMRSKLPTALQSEKDMQVQAGKDEQSILVDVDAKTYKAIKKLIKQTGNPFKGRGGRDAKGFTHTDYELLDIKRIENEALFEPYTRERQKIFRKMFEKGKLCPDIGSLQGSKGVVETTKHLEDFMKKELYWEINEHYMFHGTKPDVWQTVIKSGFDQRVTSSACMLGQGVYAAEEFTKADNYADSLTSRTPNGTELYVILARTLLGNVFLCDENHETIKNPDSPKLRRPPCMLCLKDLCTCKDQELYTSVMANGRWVFREFVVYNQFLMYPEYVIKYRRVP